MRNRIVEFRWVLISGVLCRWLRCRQREWPAAGMAWSGVFMAVFCSLYGGSGIMFGLAKMLTKGLDRQFDDQAPGLTTAMPEFRLLA